MSGMWRAHDNHDISAIHDTVRREYPWDHIKGVYREMFREGSNVVAYWMLRFDSGWQIGKFESLDAAVNYAVKEYHAHIRLG